MALALAAAHLPPWALLLLAYTAGAVANHALWVVIHECAHRLVFRGALGNRLVALLACWPQVLPAAMSFCKYHLLHHAHQGEPAFDADLPTPGEARLVGSSSLRKALWLLGFTAIQGTIRPGRLHRVRLFDAWLVANVISQAAFVGVFSAVAGGRAVAYLLLSTVFAIGLHPLGGRWISEHYLLDDSQETFSYYGPLNRVCFNVGYHNEHHDFPQVAWSRLPLLRRLAREYYDPLRHHRSWTRVMLRFIFDRDATLWDRAVRASDRRRLRGEDMDATPL
jgi:sphingolipid delta-4 desaturase